MAGVKRPLHSALRAVGRVFASGLAVLAAFLITGVAVAADASTTPDGQATIKVLVEQLGDPSFVVRETATRRLLGRGSEARGLLVDALDHEDAEIRQRVRRVLHEVLHEDFRRRVAAFASGRPLSDEQQLPSWTLYRGLTGDNMASRRLFLKAVRAEPILLESLDQDSVYAAFAIRTRANSLYMKLVRNPEARQVARQRVSANEHVVALLIAAANPAFDFDDQTGQKIFQLMQYSGLIQQLSPAANQEPVRRLAGQFIRRSAHTSLAYQTLWLSMQYELKEGLIPAESILRRGERQPYVMQNAILAVGKLGGEQHLELLKPLLDDPTPIDHRRRSGELQPQIRDVALAVTIHILGQDPKAFGFANIRRNAQTLFQANTMGFKHEQNRSAALAKWNKWVEQRGKSQPAAASDP